MRSWVYLAAVGAGVMGLASCTLIDDDAADQAYDPDGDGVYFDTEEPSTTVDSTCDGVDDDGDGAIDEDAEQLTFYADADEDGYGNPNSTRGACSAPSGYVEENTDCDDSRDDIFPAAEEYCDDADQDCDDRVDEDAFDKVTYYADDDGDGYGDVDDSTLACEAPDDHVTDSTDCDDGDATAFPDNPEYCDDVDNDCDDSIDEDALDAEVWYDDFDNDGYGDPDDAEAACEAPTGSVDNADDCDDRDNDIHPDGVESCNNDDDDCDGTVDEDATDFQDYYADADSDGYGDPDDSTESCSAPSGYADNSDDCDDSDAAINPDADEECDGSVDEDCDGTVDESTAIDADTWYADGDGDGYGDPDITTAACEQPTDYVDDDQDCDDSDADLNPDTVWYADADGDGFGNADSTTASCEEPPGYVSNDEDCDDRDSSVDMLTWYADSDSDGYGDADTTKESCDQPTDYVDDDSDCDDSDADVSPAGTEECDDGVDGDCDESVDEDCLGTNCGSDGDIIEYTTYYDSAGGTLQASSDETDTGNFLYDDYEIEVSAGDIIGVHVASSAFDAEVELLDEDCLLYDYDEDSARSTNSWLEVTFPSSGIWTVKVKGAKKTASGAYLVEFLDMTLGIGNFCDDDTYSMDVTGSSSSDSYTERLSTADKYLGSLLQPYYYDDIEFLAFYGDTITLTQSSGAIDSFLYLADMGCASLTYNDNNGASSDSRISYAITQTGVYSAIPSSASDSETGNYSVSLQATW